MRRTVALAGGVGSITAAARAAVCGAILMFAVGVAGCGGARRSEPSAPTRNPSTFAVLHTARTSADVVPPKSARFLLRSDEPSLSPLDIQHARRVIVNPPTWLVPAAEDKLCMVRTVYALTSGMLDEHLPPVLDLSCSSERAAEEGHLMATRSLSVRPGGQRVLMSVYGIVPDGVHHVAVRTGGIAPRTVTVQRNAYESIVVNPHSVSFATGRDGRRRRYVISTPSVAGAKPYPEAYPH